MKLSLFCQDSLLFLRTVQRAAVYVIMEYVKRNNILDPVKLCYSAYVYGIDLGEACFLFQTVLFAV